MPDRRRIVANNYVRYVNVTKTDAQVLQCNASNKHGYIFSNAYLNVLGQFVFTVSFIQHNVMQAFLTFKTLFNTSLPG